MESPVLEFLRSNPVFTLFITLGCGYLLGRLRIGSISLGPVAGALVISLVLGQYGFTISAGAQSVGFAMFIFAVGYQAGPRFFSVLKTQGLQYFLLSLFVVASGCFIAIACSKLIELPLGATAGLLAGGMTTTPTLAAAQEAVSSGIVTLPAGVSADTVLGTIASSYAITYVVGLLGIIAMVRVLPHLAGINLAEEAAKMEATTHTPEGGHFQARAYRVTRPEAIQPTIAELREKLWDSLAVVRLLRQGSWIQLADSEHFQLGDEIHAYGNANFFRGGIHQLGEEIAVSPELELLACYARVVVARRTVIGKRLAELDLAHSHGLVITDVHRDGVPLPISGQVRLQRGDILSITGPKPAIAAMQDILGPVESDAAETDMATFAFGIALGALVGTLVINVKEIPLGLGLAGGLLISGVLAGWLNSMRPTFGKFPEAARSILMEFGLMLFIVGVGLQAGGQIVETFLTAGPGLIVAAILVVSGPLLLGYAFGHKVLGLHPVLLMGALTGAMTSTAAMSVVNHEANSTLPSLGYTGAYAFANVMLTVAGTLLMLV